MNKQEFITIPNTIDVAGDYGWTVQRAYDVTRVNFSSGMSLQKGQWTYDADEDAIWICPNVIGSNTRGYLRFVERNILVNAGDEITIEFEMKHVGEVTDQRNGILVDVYDENLAHTGEILTYYTSRYSKEYENIKIKRKINPSFKSAKIPSFSIGVLTAPLLDNGYSLKIRNIKITINRENADIVTQPIFQNFGLGTIDLAYKEMEDRNDKPDTEARNINLKSGVYGFRGFGRGYGSISGYGMLLVLPYRLSSGTKKVEQIAIINEADVDRGVWKRGFDTDRWGDWRKISEAHADSTSWRPKNPPIGHPYFDTTLGKPIWCKTKAVVSTDGTITTQAVWVDATGTTV